MQRIKLLDGTVVQNVQEINDYVERHNQDNRHVLNITVLHTSYEEMLEAFSDPSRLSTLEIQISTDVEGEYVSQGLQNNYTILNFIKGNVTTGSFTVQLHQKSDMEQELLETQLALAELTNLIVGGNA